MAKIHRIILILILTLISCYSHAQDNALPDLVLANEAYIDTLIKNYSDEEALSFGTDTISSFVRIPVRVHVIKNRKGYTGVSQSNITESLSTANSFFKKIGIQFFIDQVDYINDYNYSFINFDIKYKELVSTYPVKNEINLFLADSIHVNSERTFGYTYFPNAPDSNYIFLDKKNTTGYYLTTMLGHYFGLLSTHDTVGGLEHVSEKNCDEAGDFICDTYADPDLFNQVDDECNYFGETRDEQGKYYVPTVANIMSNTLDKCKCDFSSLQYKRMYYYYLKYRQNLGD